MGIKENLVRIKGLMSDAMQASDRDTAKVLLLAVSKKQGIEAILQAHQLGLSDFAESYLQEAQEKIQALKQLPLCWHFIGPVQSNKTKGIASSFSWVHSVSDAHIAMKLNAHRPTHLAPLNVCLQIKLVDEATKSGIAPELACNLARTLTQLPRLQLRGLMTILPPQQEEKQQYDNFIQLKLLMNDMNKQLSINMDTLSMGMSDDFIPAIKAGSTVVRVGRALFGERK